MNLTFLDREGKGWYFVFN